MRRSQTGFTLIELLVVVLIIAILAATAIPLFLRQREKAWEADVRSALRNGAMAVESYGADNGGYAALNADPQLADRLWEHGFRIPEWGADPGYFRVKSTTTKFCIEVRHRLLSADAAWRNATYQNEVGAPQAEPDVCP